MRRTRRFGRFPKIQIATVEDLLEGKTLKLPPQEVGAGLKRVPEEKHKERTLFHEADEPPPPKKATGRKKRS